MIKSDDGMLLTPAQRNRLSVVKDMLKSNENPYSHYSTVQNKPVTIKLRHVNSNKVRTDTPLKGRKGRIIEIESTNVQLDSIVDVVVCKYCLKPIRVERDKDNLMVLNVCRNCKGLLEIGSFVPERLKTVVREPNLDPARIIKWEDID